MDEKETDEKLSQLAGQISIEAAESEKPNEDNRSSKKTATIKTKAARA